MQYIPAQGNDARGEPWLYPTLGFQGSGSFWFYEVRTPLVVAIFDAIVGAIAYVAGGDEFDLPIWSGLNDDREHVRISAFELDGRLAPVQNGRHKLDVGVHGEMLGTFLQVHGERRNAHFINVGPSVGYAMTEPDGSGAIVLSTSVGNGFGHRADVNPFLQATAFSRLRLSGPLGAYTRGQLGIQWIDYGPATTTTEVELDLVDPVTHGSFELGLILVL
jgi:hypothetical protein